MEAETELRLASLDLELYEAGLELKSIEELIREVNVFTISLMSQEKCATDIKKLEILTRILLSHMTPDSMLIEPPEAILTPTEPLIDIKV